MPARTRLDAMKTLYVLRHGQAAPEAASGSDHERELTGRGRAEVQRAAQALLRLAHSPTFVLTSSAVRARQTADLCAAALPSPAELRVARDLYLAEPPAHLRALSLHAEPHRAVLLVGHNPGLEALIHLLSRRSEPLATASLIEIELEVSAWAELSGADLGCGRILGVFRA